MFTHFLVPLDGSRMAEAPLSAARALAATLGARVTLLHIIEQNASPAIHGDRHLTSREEAEAYLKEVAANWFPAHAADVAVHVHTEGAESVASGIVDHALELGCDLVVLATHGRGGLRHRLFGSIAQRVVAQGRLPVFLVPPETGVAHAFACEKLLVPLDATAKHEAGVSTAVAFAQALGAEPYLLAVVPTVSTLSGEQGMAGTLLPGTTAALLDMEVTTAERYIGGQIARLAGVGVTATAEVGRGDPADVIVRTAKRIGADAIVLATHGKSGLDAFWSGSVAPRVSRRTGVPLLLVAIDPASMRA